MELLSPWSMAEIYPYSRFAIVPYKKY